MEPEAPVKSPVEPPDGMYSARLDDKGRLKLPSDFAHYLQSLGEKRFFVTSLDRKLGHIYPSSVWRLNKQLLAGHTDDPDAAENLLFTANELGGTAEMDTQNRILLPLELRQELGIENSPVRLYLVGDRIDIYSEAMVLERRQASKASSKDDLKKMRAAGLK
jgi:MraZ protein